VTTRAGVGRSQKRVSAAAAREAVAAALAPLQGAAPDFCLLFATSGHDLETVVREVRAAAPGAALSGCSAEGVIAGGISDETEHSIALLAIASDSLRFTTFLVPGYDTDPARAGQALALAAGEAGLDDALGLLVFPDGLTGNCEALLSALQAGLGRPVPIAGGAAGDALAFRRTHQFRDDTVTSGAVAAVLVRGRGSVVTDVSHGCQAIGLERRVTRADGGWVHEIDGRPAWEVFREYLDGEPEDLNTEGAIYLSLGVPFPEGLADAYEPYIIRTPMGLDRETGSMFFPGGGFTGDGAIRLSRRDPVRVCQSARASAERLASRGAGRRPAFVLQFDCAGRGRQLFGSRVSENIVRPLQEVVGNDVPWLGFHTYGEIAPVGERAHYHNYTAALFAVFDGA
jgi:hypothetical protein